MTSPRSGAKTGPPMDDPIARFREALDRALASAPYDATAMTLATADASGRPSARVVLLKGVDERGFVFYTNRLSRKGRELADNPRAALVVHWPHSREQLRIEGGIELVSDAESDAYFATRPRESQLGAWASKQSEPLSSRAELVAKALEYGARYLGRMVPRPPHWGGYRLLPEAIEFWKEGAFRIHDREVYRRQDGVWAKQRLFP